MSENIFSQIKVLYWWLHMANVAIQTQIFAISACISPSYANDYTNGFDS